MQEALLDGIFQVIVLGTGHAAMWAATLGRWKPTNSRDRVAAIAGLFVWAVLAFSVGLAVSVLSSPTPPESFGGPFESAR